MIHAAICFVFCVVIALVKGPLLCCLFPACLYIGREFAQAEYRYIEEYCGRKRAKMPWYAPFTPKAWTWKGFFDWVLPCVVCVGVMLITYAIQAR